jgi:hypothetical protein
MSQTQIHLIQQAGEARVTFKLIDESVQNRINKVKTITLQKRVFKGM